MAAYPPFPAYSTGKNLATRKVFSQPKGVLYTPFTLSIILIQSRQR